MDRDTRIERILECMLTQHGISFIHEPVCEAGELDMMPLFKAYKERNAVEFFDAYDKLVTGYWTPPATEEAKASEVHEDIENRYRRGAAFI